MQSIFNTTSLQAKWNEQLSHYCIYDHGNIIADVCPSGQFIRFVNASMQLYVDRLDEIKTIMDAISKQYKKMHPEQPA